MAFAYRVRYIPEWQSFTFILSISMPGNTNTFFMSDHKSQKAGKIIAWLQIAMGIVFLTYTAFKYVNDGHHLARNMISLALIFGVVLPMTAVSTLHRLKKKEQQQAAEEEEKRG